MQLWSVDSWVSLGKVRQGYIHALSLQDTEPEGRNILGMRLYFVQLRLTMPYIHIFFIIHVYVNRYVCRVWLYTELF